MQISWGCCSGWGWRATRLGGQEQAALALVTYPILAAILAGLTRNAYTALTVAYVLALAMRGTVANTYTRTLLIVASLAILPLTPLVTTPSVFHAPLPASTVVVRVEKIPLLLHTLLVYHDPHTGTTTRVLSLDWGQIGALTLAAEAYMYRKAKKRQAV